MTVQDLPFSQLTPGSEAAGTWPAACVGQALEAMDQMMPLHVTVDRGSGRVRHAGPTLCRLVPDRQIAGEPFLELFEVRRPAGLTQVGDLLGADRGRVRLHLRGDPPTSLIGQVAPLAGGSLVAINLSFGIGVAEAVRRFRLTAGDFPATDLTVEMLYLVEAKSAVQLESDNLTKRLQGEKTAAEEKASTDTLTGLKNRRALDECLAQLIATEADFGMMHLDLDYFKQVNDTYGHAAGDAVLARVAEVLTNETRERDTVARVGGDEFVILIDGLTDADRLISIGRRIIAQLEVPVTFEGHQLRISGSVGVTHSALYEELDAAGILHDADMALYASKNGGRGRATLWDPENKVD